jgi:uncharacterized membrane protein YgcG
MNSPRAISRSLFAASVILLAVVTAFSQNSNQFSINESPLGPPSGYVNDYAGVLDEATKQQIESKIKQFKDASNPTTELAVAIVRTTGDRDIFDYSLAVARGWKIGSKQDDNPGALLFIAIDDRKYFTQVSRDLEDELPDALVGNLQRQYLVPAFRQSNYGKGIVDTIDAYIRTIQDRRSGAVSTNALVCGAVTSPPERSLVPVRRTLRASENWKYLERPPPRAPKPPVETVATSWVTHIYSAPAAMRRGPAGRLAKMPCTSSLDWL